MTAHSKNKYLFALLALTLFFLQHDRTFAEKGWQDLNIQSEFYVASRANYSSNTDNQTWYGQAITNGWVSIKPNNQSFSIGTFVDFRYALDRSYNDHVNLGIFSRHGSGSWDLTNWLYNNKPSTGSSNWIYASRLRYRIDARSRIGLEAATSFNHPENINLELGYFGELSNSTILSFVIGTDSRAAETFSFRTEFEWQIKWK